MFNPEAPPELEVASWLNSETPLSLAGLRGRVVVLVAFQMLCPGCVEHGLPQAKRIRARFRADEVAVLGLHTVFEHHGVMTPAALAVFQHEYRWPFPIAVDRPDGDGVPRTMAAYQMQGTPSLLIFDKAGRLRRHYFGRPDDMLVAAEIAALALEDAAAPREQAAATERRLARALASPAHDHDHKHDHEHAHDHGHTHDEGCGCGHEHDHAHDHHDHEHQSGHGAEPGKAPRT